MCALHTKFVGLGVDARPGGNNVGTGNIVATNLLVIVKQVNILQHKMKAIPIRLKLHC